MAAAEGPLKTDKTDEEEKDGSNKQDKNFQPIKSCESNRQNLSCTSDRKDESRPSSRGLASLHHTRSYGDGHGFICFNDDENHAEEGTPEGEDAEKKRFEVQWKENDPAHPRSMSALRKWTIVLIVSSSSTCVYV